MKKILAFVFCLSIVLTGCSGGSSDITITAAANEEVTEHYIDVYNESGESENNYVWEPITGDYQSTLKTRIAGGEEICVMYIDQSLLPELADAGTIVPLDDYITDDKSSQYLQSVYDMWQYDGEQYALPTNFNTLGMFYNKDLFDEAGLDYPDETWTWEDYNNAMNEIEPTLKDGQVAFSAGNEYDRWRALALSTGDDVVDEDGNLTFTDEGVVDSYQAWVDMYYDGLYSTPAELGTDWGGQAFFEEKAAITLEGSWAISAIEGGNPDMNYGVAPIPKENEDSELNTMIYSGGIAIGNECSNQEGAWDFVDWYTTPDIAAEAHEYQISLGTASSGIPANAELSETFLADNPIYSIFAEGGEYGQSSGTNTTYDGIIIDSINAVLEESLYEQDLTAEEQLQKAEDDVKAQAGIE